MNRVRTVVIFAMAVVLLVAFNAYGAKMTYNPDSISVTLEPGGKKDIVLDGVLIEAGRGYYSIEFLTGVSGDEELAGWVSSPANEPVNMNKVTNGTYKASTTISIEVGEGASGGTYEGALKSIASELYGTPIDNGDGVPISVTVLSAGCVEAPMFVGDVSAGPKEIWARNKRDVEVEFSGKVTLPEDCENTVKYEVIDEYGEEGVGVPETALGVNPDGSFGATFTVPAARKGGDKDGRRYTVKVTVENEVGKATSEVYATVAHDQRKK